MFLLYKYWIYVDIIWKKKLYINVNYEKFFIKISFKGKFVVIVKDVIN